MLVFDSVDLMQWLAQFFLPFFRMAAFFATVPIFGNQLVPIPGTILYYPSVPSALFRLLNIIMFHICSLEPH